MILSKERYPPPGATMLQIMYKRAWFVLTVFASLQCILTCMYQEMMNLKYHYRKVTAVVWGPACVGSAHHPLRTSPPLLNTATPY